MEWLKVNWYWIALAVGVAIQVLNGISKHWPQHAGLRRVCLFVAEMLSVVTSAGARTDLGGKLKLPFTSVRPGGGK
jgi:hypothetical protein